MASEALRIIKDAPEQKNPSLFCDSLNVRFPVESELMWAVVMGSPLKYAHNDDHSINARVNLVNLGDAQILTIPGEALPKHRLLSEAQDARKAQPAVWPDERSFRLYPHQGGFQSFPRYDYVSRTSLGEMTGEILIEKSLELVNKSPRPE